MLNLNIAVSSTKLMAGTGRKLWIVRFSSTFISDDFDKELLLTSGHYLLQTSNSL